MGTKHTDRCLARVDDDEPIFTLRAQDKSAPGTVLRWLAVNRQLDPDRRAEVEQVIAEMRAWQAEHPERVKAAD